MNTFLIVALILFAPLVLFAVVQGLRVYFTRQRKVGRPRHRRSMLVIRKAPVVLLRSDAVQEPTSNYDWEGGDSAGLPEVWEDDLMLRRN